MVAKERLDLILLERGFFPSRERAKAAVMAGVVRVNGQIELKAGTLFGEGVEIEITENPLPYVSRGGLKLEKALAYWGIDLNGAVAMDIGASTGGFTDLMLQSGARKVYAIDVGYGQLDWKLRGDVRVVNLERTNIRYLDLALIDEKPDFISIDVSFISLKLVLPVAAACMGSGGQIVALVKPQFEAERRQVGKKGIIKDVAVHAEVLEKIKDYAAQNGLNPSDAIESPIKGAKGNTEFLMRFKRDDSYTG